MLNSIGERQPPWGTSFRVFFLPVVRFTVLMSGYLSIISTNRNSIITSSVLLSIPIYIIVRFFQVLEHKFVPLVDRDVSFGHTSQRIFQPLAVFQTIARIYRTLGSAVLL